MPEHQNGGQGNEEDLSRFKEIIVEKAQKGIFNNNPLLSTIHVVTCQKCTHRQHIVYLDYLKSGEFELGKTEQVKILDPQGPNRLLRDGENYSNNPKSYLREMRVPNRGTTNKR